MVKPSQDVIDRHNDVTRTIIIGAICERMSGFVPGQAVKAADDIMDLLKRRGYEPQIRDVNQLRNGKRI
jgi:hypothetical protein